MAHGKAVLVTLVEIQDQAPNLRKRCTSGGIALPCGQSEELLLSHLYSIGGKEALMQPMMTTTVVVEQAFERLVSFEWIRRLSNKSPLLL